MNESAVRGLCSAIILQAIIDLGKSIDYIRTHNEFDDPITYSRNMKRYNECRSFFLSEWFANINPLSVSGKDMLVLISANPVTCKKKIGGAFYGIQ